MPKGLQSEKYFFHAHVAAKNDFDFFAACGRQALQGFLIKCVSKENLRSNCYEYDTKRQGSGAGADPDRLPNGRRSRTFARRLSRAALGGNPQGHRQRRLHHHLLPGRRQGPAQKSPGGGPDPTGQHGPFRQLLYLRRHGGPRLSEFHPGHPLVR